MSSKEFTLLLIRLSLGFIYLSAGLSKLAPEYLGNIIGPVDLSKIIESNLLLGLMSLIAVIQAIIGALILTQRYSLIGLIALLPLSIGTLIFTMIAGFGGTPFINAFLLVILFIALWNEKKAIKKLIRFDLKGLNESNWAKLFPDIKIPTIALSLIIIIILISSFGGLFLNLLTSIALLLFTINLFQKKSYLFVDRLIIILFTVISLIPINALILKEYIPKIFYSVFFLIAFGFVLYFIRLIIWKFKRTNKD